MMRGPDHDDASSEQVRWESSSPSQVTGIFLPSDPANTGTPSRSLSANIPVDQADVPDPAAELLDKYSANLLGSSPPQTYPQVTFKRAVKHRSEASGLPPQKNLRKMYSPGYRGLKSITNLTSQPPPKLPRISSVDERCASAPLRQYKPVSTKNSGAQAATTDLGLGLSLGSATNFDELQQNKENLLPSFGSSINLSSEAASTELPRTASPPGSNCGEQQVRVGSDDIDWDELDKLDRLLQEQPEQLEVHAEVTSDSNRNQPQNGNQEPANPGPAEANSNSSSSQVLPISAGGDVENTEMELDISDIDFSDLEQDLHPTEDYTAVLTRAKQALPLAYKHNRLHRYYVSSISRCDSPVVTVLECVHSHGVSQISLEQSWAAADVRVGDIIHIVGTYDINDAEVRVNHKTNILIVLPDFLVPATAVAEAFQCERKVVLRMRHRTSGDSSKVMVYGNVLHEVIQRNLSQGPYPLEQMANVLRELLVDQFLEDLLLLGIDVTVAETELASSLHGIVEWTEKFLMSYPRNTITMYRSTSTPAIAITAVEELENELWSPVYGLKGIVDVMVRVKSLETGEFRTCLEIKTGKSTQNSAHRAQVMLYTLLLESTEDKPVPWGLLYYSAHQSLIAVTPRPDELRAILQKRNTLARYFAEHQELPELTNDSGTCQWCPRISACSIYAAVQHNDLSQFPLKEEFERRSAFMTMAYSQFFTKWDNLITLEGANDTNLQSLIWKMPARQREVVGDAFANVVVTALEEEVCHGIQKSYFYKLGRKGGARFPDTTRLVNSAFFVVSDDVNIRVAAGRVELNDDTSDQILVSVDRPLKFGVTYRLDHENYGLGISTIRHNLVKMFTNEGPTTPDDPNDALDRWQKTRFLELIVDLKPPVFAMPDNERIALPPGLNQDQQLAARQVLCAQDYMLILGMPGTGKTTTIVEILKLLIARKKTVLISAYTNSAVDNIVLKLAREGIDALRIGNPSRVHPDVSRLVGGHGDLVAKTEQQLHDIYLAPPVVATTSLSVRSWVFAKRTFDYCILDEASQLTLPNCIGPLQLARKFVMVGDHYQLEPLVRDRDAIKGGMRNSLFKILSDAHPEAVVSLRHQYRMSEDIMQLSSSLFYKNQLLCGSPAVASQKLHLPHPVGFPEFLRSVMEPSHRVVFLDTDPIGAEETELHDGIVNAHEVDLIEKIVNTFRASGVEDQQMGIISIYRAQRRLLIDRLGISRGLEVLTADQAQGRDMDCVIISLVRANHSKEVGLLLRDWRRINVTFTRAKSKLIIVGSRRTLSTGHALKEFLRLVDSRGWSWEAGDVNEPNTSQVAER